MHFRKTITRACLILHVPVIIWFMDQMTASPTMPQKLEGHKKKPFQLTDLSAKPVVIGRRGLERLDLLLLVIEALDLNASKGLLWTSDKLGLQDYFPNHVELWKCRCHNPLRKTARRGQLNSMQSEALILLISTMADKIYPDLRQLISSKEPANKNQERWELFYARLIDLISERFNNRRSAVKKLLSYEYTDALFRNLILTLALSVGPGGVDRLRASLMELNY